jgi:myosin-1
MRLYQAWFFSDLEKTGKAVHIIVTLSTKDGTTQSILERKVPLITIRSIAMSNLRDDWIVSAEIMSSRLVFTYDRSTAQALNTNNISEEGDPVFSCYFKTELASTLLQLTSASINLVIGPLYVVLCIPLSDTVLILR